MKEIENTKVMSNNTSNNVIISEKTEQSVIKEKQLLNLNLSKQCSSNSQTGKKIIKKENSKISSNIPNIRSFDNENTPEIIEINTNTNDSTQYNKNGYGKTTNNKNDYYENGILISLKFIKIMTIQMIITKI